MLPLSLPTFFHVFLLLVVFHFLLDFAIQGDFVAKFKARYIMGEYNPMWPWVLTAHCMAHTLSVLLITGSLLLSAIMFITHFLIDLSKCEMHISFKMDQILHLFVIFLISAIYYFVL